MRTVVNISLPKNLSNVVDAVVEQGEYASKSEFFRNLLRLWIVGRELEESRSELKRGGGKLLRSLKNLR